jgi:hypothetical protein
VTAMLVGRERVAVDQHDRAAPHALREGIGLVADALEGA